MTKPGIVGGQPDAPGCVPAAVGCADAGVVGAVALWHAAGIVQPSPAAMPLLLPAVSLALLLTTASATAQTYRCTVDGKTVYQQQPCEGGKAIRGDPGLDPSSREFRLARAIATGEAFVGMTEAELVRSRGKPKDVVRVQASRGPADVWYYDATAVAPRLSVMVRDGVVVNVQR